MKILALEFSSSHRSVAVLDTKASKPRPAGISRESEGRETHAFAMIEKALEQSGLSRESIECLCVGLGPGSYTGIRVAISVAQGWQLGRGVKLLGISSVDCLAAQAKAQRLHGSVSIAIDAQRNELYLASYKVSDAAAELTQPLRIVSADEIAKLISKGEPVMGPDLSGSFPRARDLWPDAATLAQIAAGRADFIPGEQLEPIYLRPATFVKAPPPRIMPP